MIVISILKGKYIETADNTFKKLSPFQDFLKYERYKAMKSLHVFMKQLILTKSENWEEITGTLRTMQRKLYQTI